MSEDGSNISRRTLLRSGVTAATLSSLGPAVTAPVSGQPETRLRSRWPFENSLRDSVGDNDLKAALGEPEFGTYHGRDGMALDGDTGLRISRGGNETLTLADPSNGPNSLSMWVYFDTPSGGRPLGDSETAGHSLYRNDTGLRVVARPVPERDSVDLRVSISPYGNPDAESYGMPDDANVLLPTGTWTHIAVVVDPANSLRVYVDGQSEFTDRSMDGQNGHSPEAWSDITLGSWYGGNPEEWAGLLDGKLSDVRVYDMALPSDYVRQLYEETAGRSPPEETGEVTLAPAWRLVDLAAPVPIGEFEGATDRGYATWVEDGELVQTWLHPDKASVEQVPAGPVLFRVYNSVAVSAERARSADSGTRSVGGEGWAAFTIDESVPFSQFCGESPRAYLVDGGEFQSRSLAGEGDLPAGTYLAKVDPPCTIDFGGGDTDPSRPSVVDINGNPVADATVLTYDAAAGDVRDSNSTNADGTLPSDVGFGEDSLVVVKESGWFAVLAGEPPSDEVVLDKQVLSYPTPVEAEGDTYAVVSLWREVDPENPREQVIYPEVVDANERGGESSNSAVYEVTPNGQNPHTRTYPDSGVFNFSYPESKLRLDRPRYSSDENGMSPESVTVMGQFRPAGVGDGLAPIERWHPLRTSLPAYPFPTASSDDGGFTELGGNDEGQERAADLAKLGVSTALGPIATISEATNILFGGALSERLAATRRFGNYNIGDEVSMAEFKDATTPATHDSVSTPWKPGDSAPAVPLVAATQALPVTIADSADRCSVVVRASWSPWYGNAVFSAEKTLWPIQTAPGE